LNEAKHGIDGYGVVVTLSKKIYGISGYYCDWRERNVLLFAREVNVSAELITGIVESCFEQKLSSREMFERHKFLTSSGIQKRWKKSLLKRSEKTLKLKRIST